MKRLIEKDLLAWKSKPDRKPLIIYGARQVGKTHSMVEFGRDNYESTAYFFFENNQELQSIFNKGVNDIRILFGDLERFSGKEIKPQKTLVIFDEIQACPAAISALKRIQETANEYHVVCGGSLLGLALVRDARYSFPVGKVDLLNMYPMNFPEFLLATNGNSTADVNNLIEQVKECFEKDAPMPSHWHELLLQNYRKYLIVGGMPECVAEYIKTNDWTMVRAKQLSICEIYTNDMVKYCTKTEAMKNISTYNCVPAQLARENTKFQFNLIKSGARSKDFADSLHWLEKASIIIKVSKTTQGNSPIAIFEDFLSFKIYMSDVGLLTAKSGLSPTLILSHDFSSDMKGAVAENFVAVELVANGIRPFYWESEGKAEVDFVYQRDDKVVPIEVKANTSTKTKSLDMFVNKYNIEKSIRVSAKPFGYANGIKSIPLYAVWCIR